MLDWALAFFLLSLLAAFITTYGVVGALLSLVKLASVGLAIFIAASVIASGLDGDSR